MKTWHSLSRSGPAAALMLAGVLVLTTGCVEDHVTYVRPAYTVTGPAPEAPPPPPEPATPPPMVALPPAPPPAPVAPVRSAAELDTMLAPIALYPDPLLAQILPAATLPEQVVLADRYVRDGGDMSLVDAQPWDNSLKALARYPGTLRMLDDNLAWTTDLGQAFVNQPADVMDSVQRLRAQARAVGNLVSTPQQTVVVDAGLIEIVPAAPEVIYVPVYQPEVVYVRPPPAPGRFWVSFSTGFVVGAWLNHDCDWHDHEVIVWHHDHPRPVDWWYHPSNQRERPTVVNNVTIVNNTTIVKQNVTVWHPRPHDAAPAHGDRGWGQPTVRTPTPTRNEVVRPVREGVHPPQPVVEAHNPTPPRDNRPAPPTRDVRPAGTAPATEVHAVPPRETIRPTPVQPTHEARVVPPAKETPPAPGTVKPQVTRTPAPEAPRANQGQPPPVLGVKPSHQANPPIVAPKETRPAPAPVAARQPAVATPSPRPAPAPATPRPVVKAPARESAGALAGIESPRVTREASARGQQSREAIAKPVAPSHQAPVKTPKADSSETKEQKKGR